MAKLLLGIAIGAMGLTFLAQNWKLTMEKLEKASQYIGGVAIFFAILLML